MTNDLSQREKQSIVIGMHAMWMSLRRIVGATPVIGCRELESAMARYVHNVANTWNFSPVDLHEELNRIMDEIEQIPVHSPPEATHLPEHNN